MNVLMLDRFTHGETWLRSASILPPTLESIIHTSRAYRRGVMWIALVVVGVSSVRGVAADAIGDPWWDDCAPPAAEERPAEEPADKGLRCLHDARRKAAMNFMRRDLSLLRGACPSLSVAQRAKVVAAGRLAIDQLAMDGARAAAEQRPEAPGVVVKNQGGSRMAEAQATVGVALATALQEVASADQVKAYERDLAARAERRRAAALAVLVNTIDQTAMLDVAKREALAIALEKNWQPFWEQAALQTGQTRMTGARLPPGVAAVVADVLGREAFHAWQERLRRQPES